MFNIYFNDGVNEPVVISTSTTIEIAKEYINNYLKGQTLVDDEHMCIDDVFNSSAVAQLEVYDGEIIKTDDDGEEYFDDPVFTSDYFYTR